MKSIKVCEYSRSRSFHDDLILQDQASGERSQDQWYSGFGSKAIPAMYQMDRCAEAMIISSFNSSSLIK